ncbi:MAG: HAD-IC family P-type ATPase [Planctomycetes bacterium]|nr:HAD-IC family P-type ATPase [Planctomycetota bacterium]
MVAQVNSPAPHARSVAAVAEQLAVDAARGLGAAEVVARRARVGPNALPEPSPPSPWVVLLRPFRSPLVALLLVAALVALAIGEWVDAVVIAVVVVGNALIGTMQERRAEASLRALRRLQARTARVVRDGAEQVVPAHELVPGDVLLLAAGDCIGADARVVEAASLTTAEAALTGESLPVEKRSEPVAEDALLADRSSMLFAGTYVAAGRGRALVVATGAATEIGDIARLVTGGELPTPLERRIARLGRVVLALAVVLFVAVVSVGLVRGVPMHEILMVGISQIVGLVPEGLPVAMTIALAVGVQRMAARRAIVRRLSAVETLGSTTVVCTDKTGTLTRNEMTVTTIALADGRLVEVGGVGYQPSGALALDGRRLCRGDVPELDDLLQAVVLCNDAAVQPPDAAEPTWRPLGDPTEVALVVLAQKAGFVPHEVRRRWGRVAELPFDADAKMMATRHGGEAGRSLVVGKGAPEAVLAICTSWRSGRASRPLDAAAATRLRRLVDELAGRALRVLAVATRADDRLDVAAGFAGLGGFELLGFVGQIDPPREAVHDAVAKCRAAGVRTVMVTGDHRSTGLAIAQAIGIARPGDEAVDGRELAALDDAALQARLDRIAVFARVQPAQKVRIVTALQARGAVVAMTGDGVNDAPALVRADVGVAMGASGTEVAKDAAKVVLVDDDFATLVAAVEEGRVVYGNVKKAVLLLLSTSFAEVVVLLLAMALGHPPPFAAVQILWNNLVTEGLVTVNLVLEPAEGDEMQRAPTPVDEPLLDRVLRQRLWVMVPTIAGVVLGWFLWRSAAGVEPAQVRTEAFTLLALCEWCNVLNCRSTTRSAFAQAPWRNPWLLGGLVLGNVLQFAVVFAPPLQAVFHTVPFGFAEFVWLGVVASTVLWVEELRKLLVRRRERRG